MNDTRKNESVINILYALANTSEKELSKYIPTSHFTEYTDAIFDAKYSFLSTLDMSMLAQIQASLQQTQASLESDASSDDSQLSV